MKSFVINFPGNNGKTPDTEEDTIYDAFTIKGDVKTDAMNLGNNDETLVTLEFSSVNADGTPFLWGPTTPYELSCESMRLDDGRYVVLVWLERGEA